MATTFSLDSFNRGASLQRVRWINEGLPASALRSLIDGKVIAIADLVGVVASRRTLDRRLADNATLTLEESDRLARFTDILTLATEVLGGRAEAMDWLRTPQFAFEDELPITLMRTHVGGELVTHLLRQIQHGMLA